VIAWRLSRYAENLPLPVFKFYLLLSIGLPVGVLSQDFRITPEKIIQGNLLQVTGNSASKSARLKGHTIPLYEQSPGGASLGLMPVPVLIKPGTYQLEWLDAKGAVLHTQAILVRNAHYPAQNIVLSQSLTQLRSTPQERNRVGEFQKGQSAVRYWSFPLQVPLDGCLTSLFGVQRLHNGKPTGDFHAGLDQRGATGTPIHAVTAGTVKLAGQFALHGGTVGVDHGQGLKSIYLHMSKVAAQEGEHVNAGDVIGYVGSTGRSTGSHLHWALYANGEPVNPLQWVHLVPCTTPAPSQATKKP
jgi:murein DD-endopeptidase MepM/ murein hydrolase activator NlpD